MPPARKLFYGWVIAGCALVTLLITNGLTIGGLTVFDEVLLRDFGWSRGALKARDAIQFTLAGLLAPLGGALADRFGVKRLMLAGAALLAVSFVLYARIQSAAHMYAIHVLFGLTLALCGLVVCIILVSRWFVARRGTSIGITLIGTSLGGVIFPVVGRILISSYGWREAFLALAALPALLFLVIAVLVKSAPEDIGLHALGTGAAASEGPRAVGGMAYGQALRTRTFWTLALAAMMTFYSILGVSAHLFLHLRGLGFEVKPAAQGVSLLFLMGLVGKFLFGYLADVVDRKRVFVANLAVMLAGSLCLASLSASLFWPFLVLFGVGWGGLYTLLQVLTMNSFGLRAGGKILGTITVLDAIGGGMGPWVTGILFDRTGSYRIAFLVVSGLIAVALVAGASLPRPRMEAAAEA